MRLVLIVLLHLLPIIGIAQGKLSGVVRDSVTHEPLAFASVFLANTTLGATTTEQGQFEFKRVPAGTYDVVSSYVGYRLSKQTIRVAAGAGAAPQQLTLSLAPTGQQLAEVVVQPAPNKPEDFQRFSDLLLGRSTFSAQCRISNPEQVRVLYDDSTRELSARTKQFVEIENQALGYRLKYYGLYFNYDVEEQSITYYGEPKFEELTPRDDAQRQRWAANRERAYLGSFMHFLRGVYYGRLREARYVTQQVRPAPNPRFARAERQRQDLLARRPEAGFTPTEQDSLARWEREPAEQLTLFPAPRPLDSLRRVSTDGLHTYLRFGGELQVSYFGEAPDPRYGRPREAPGAVGTAGTTGAVAATPDAPTPLVPATTKPATAAASPRQVSRLRLNEAEAEIRPDGSLMNPLDVSIGGYWGFEKIGEFLPLDYVPTTKAALAPVAPAPARKRR